MAGSNRKFCEKELTPVHTMPQPKAIFFDFDETLAENIIPIPKLFGEMYYQFSEQLGADHQDTFFTALRANASQLWGSMFDKPQAPEQQMVECFANSIRAIDVLSTFESGQLADLMFNRFLELSSSNVRLHDGATETLATLKRAGFITGIITNGIEQLQLGKIHRLDLHNQVDHVIVSAQARAHKPHARVFELALNRAQVDAHRAWQVGDNATNDVAGAIRAGMAGVFYDPSKRRLGEAFEDLAETPTHVVHHLLDIVDLALQA